MLLVKPEKLARIGDREGDEKLVVNDNWGVRDWNPRGREIRGRLEQKPAGIVGRPSNAYLITDERNLQCPKRRLGWG